MGATDPRSDRIELRGLRVVAAHGVLAEEQERAQPFEIDLDLDVDLAGAAASDRIEDTVDYGAVVTAVAAAAAGPRSGLLERVAARVADAALAAAGPRATAVTVSIRKLRPPVPADLASAGVRLTRLRERP